MEWVEITVEGVIERLPTDVKARYDAWLVSYPDKAGRLAEITANTIREFRDNIKSVPKNYWHEDESYLPQSAVRHVDTIIVFTLAMEMGLSIDTAGTAARYAADIFLRQILMGRYTTTTEEGGEGTPRYNAPTRDTAGRALPAFLAVMLAFVQFAAGGWIRPDSTIYDTEVMTTFVPSDYSISSATLFGHLYGIDSALDSVSTNKASVLIYNGITNTASAGAFNLGDLPFISNSNCNWRILTSCEDIQYLFGTNVIMRLAYGETDLPDILSFAAETNPPTLTITFAAIGTSNLLETTTNHADWATCNDCTWSYTNGTGTVVATEVDLDTPTWARIVSMSGIVSTNPYLHVTAPIYSGSETSAATRVATFGEIVELRTTKAARTALDAYVPLSSCLMAQSPANISTNTETGIVETDFITPGELYSAWVFDSDAGTAFFNAATVSNLTLGGVTRTDWPTISTESDPLYSAWATNGPGATNAILADGTLVSIDGWGSGAGGSGATQLVINAAGSAAVTSTLAGAVLTVADLPVPEGGIAATTNQPYVKTNAVVPHALLSNGETNFIQRGTNSTYYIDLTNATSYVSFSTDFDANCSADIRIEIRGTNSLTMLAGATPIAGWQPFVTLSTNTVLTLWTKLYGETQWTAAGF